MTLPLTEQECMWFRIEMFKLVVQKQYEAWVDEFDPYLFPKQIVTAIKEVMDN